MKYTENTKVTQSGMTLIELSVVLLVMVGLAGVAVPYVAGMADKAHDSTTASTINSLNQAIAKFKSDHNALPERLETLTDASGVIGYLINKVNYTDNLFSTTDTNADGTAANVALSFQRAGMSAVFTNKADAAVDNGNHTFGAPNARQDLTAATPFAYVQGAGGSFWGGALSNLKDHLAYALGGNRLDYDESCYSYVAMGVGDNSELIGKGLQSAPVLFMPNGDLGPEKKYSRFIAIFKVQSNNGWGSMMEDGTTPCPDQIQPATFLGAVADMDFGALVGAKASQQWSTSAARQ